MPVSGGAPKLKPSGLHAEGVCVRGATEWVPVLRRVVEFVNSREETIANGVAKAIGRHGDGVHDVRVKNPL